MSEAERDGDFEFECPSCNEASERTVLATQAAFMRSQIEGGLRFSGIRCPTCGKSYTIEATDAAPPEGVDPDAAYGET